MDYPPKRWHGVAIVVCIAAVYFGAVTDQWWPTPDSALYQGLGRSLVHGEGYRFNGQVNNDVTPGLPMILAGLRWAFGDGFLAPNLFVTACGLASLLLAYASLARLADRRTALAVALATACCFKYFHYSHLILTDLTFSALLWALVYVTVRFLQGSAAWLPLAGAIAAAAVAVRAPGLLILAPLAAGVVLDRRSRATRGRRLMAGGAILVAVGATAAAFLWLARRVSEKTPVYVNPKIVDSSVLDRAARLGAALRQLPEVVARMYSAQNSAILGTVLVLLAVAGMARLWRSRRRLSAATCALCVVASGLVGGGGAVRTRYMIALFPMGLLLIVHGLWWLIELAYRARSKPMPAIARLVAMNVFVAILIVVNVPKMVRDTVQGAYEAYRGRYYEVIEHGKFADLPAVARFLRENFDRQTPIAMRRDRVSILHLLSERRTVGFLKTPRRTAAEAETVYSDLLAGDVRTIVHDTWGVNRAFADRLSALLEGTGGIERIFDGRICRIYRRVRRPPRATGPATRPTR